MSRIVRTLLVVSIAIVTFGVAPAAHAATAAMPSDFNGDGYADLAIAAPGEDLGTKTRAGAVNVLYGSQAGLSATHAQRWHQDRTGVKGTSHRNEYFGKVLASGDFDADGFADLAIGVPNDNDTGLRHAGAVNVLYGSTAGLTPARDQRWWQKNLPDQAEEREHFGAALASADFDHDGYWDLAIGVPAESVGDVLYAGIVQVVYGGRDGLSSLDAIVLTRASIGASVEVLARFGTHVAAGDFDGDDSDDLAIGDPWVGGGGVGVVYGDPAGLGAGGHQRWTQDTAGILGTADDVDLFGCALASGDFDANTVDDLAIGAMGDVVPTCGATGCGAGAVAVLYGTPSGLSATGNQLWTQDSGGVPGVAGDEWAFGFSVAAGDFDGNGADDLAVGAPGEDDAIGSVTILPGGATGLTAEGAMHWTQDAPGLPGRADNNVVFGWSVASHDFAHSGRADLAIGAIGGEEVVVLYGTSTGLGTVNADLWSQASPGVPGNQESGDHFGWTFSP